jgi:hypothetical protein
MIWGFLMKPDVKKVLTNEVANITDSNVAVLLSGGIDSASILFALLEAGKTVKAYSFMLGKKTSTDFKLGQKNAKTFNVEFIPIFLPTDINVLKNDLLILKNLGAKKKTDFECGWPMLYSYKTITEHSIGTGLGADGHFCISKKGMIHYRDNIDVFRKNLFSSKTYAQMHIHKNLCALYNKSIFAPYLSESMKNEFLGTTWDAINKPKQKQPILNAYPDQFKKIKIMPHINLQLGDSGIANHFTKLLQTNWNKGGYKSVVGIYNGIAKGVINENTK